MLDELVKYGLRINHAAMFESYRDGVWNPPATFTDYDLLVFTSGVGSCLINGRQHTVSPRDILLMRRGDTMERPFSAGRMANMLAHFDFIGENGEPVDPPEEILPPRFPAHADHLMISNVMQACIKSLDNSEPLAAKALLRSILLLLAQQPEGQLRDFSVAHRSRLFGEFARRILDDPALHRNVSDLADEAGMSAVQFTRCFREHTGHPPGEFMVLARIERAKLLLSTTSRSVADVANCLGFSDVYFFTRQFASRAGAPPAAFRTKKRKKSKSKR
jgi:AraC-like DNA-binding protein